MPGGWSVSSGQTFLYTPEEQRLMHAARAFAQQEILPTSAEAHRRVKEIKAQHAPGPERRRLLREMARAYLGRIGEAGLTGALFPEAYGGNGRGVVAECLIAEELAAAGHPADTIRSVSLTLGTISILRYGTEAEDRDGPEREGDRPDRVGGVARGRELLGDEAFGDDAPAVAAVRLGKERAGQPGFADAPEIGARHLAQQAAPLGPRRVLGLDLLHPAVRLGGRRQDLLLGEGPRRVHEPLLLRRVEERLAARDGPAAGHGQVGEADGTEQLGVEAHWATLPASFERGPRARGGRGWPENGTLERPLAEGRVVLLGHERRTSEGHDALAALVLDARLHGDRPAVAALRLARVEHGRLGVERVADEHRRVVGDLLDLEVGDGASRHVRHGHPDPDREDERPQDQPLPMLGVLLGVVRVRVDRVLIHRQEGEPGAVRLADRSPRPVAGDLADRELLEIASVGHRVAQRRWAASRRTTRPPAPSPLRIQCKRPH